MDTMMWAAVIAVLALAIGMALFALRLLRSDRERTEARAAMLRQLAFEPEPVLNEKAFQTPTFASIEPVFGATVDRTPPGSRRLMAVGVVVVFMAIGAASVYGLYKPSSNEQPDNPGRTERVDGAQPLELISLSHRTDAEDFVVAGLVQNPADGHAASSVMAVVYVFNSRGEYFASGKAALEFGPLAPGAESPFTVRLPKTPGVTRFRVGFRAQDGSVVAHVDRRGQPLEGTTSGTMPGSAPSGGR